MTAVRQGDIQADPEKYLELAASGEAVSIPRKAGGSVVMISEEEFRNLNRAKHNLEYLEMLNESRQQYREGRVVVKTMEELEAMANG